MPQFRKKPVVIEAWCNTGDLPHRSAFPVWLSEAMSDGRAWFSGGHHGHVTIKTLEGDMRANYGDWIIRGVAGEIYPCKPEIFKATYEAVESCHSDEAAAVERRRCAEIARRGAFVEAPTYAEEEVSERIAAAIMNWKSRP